MPAVEEFDCGRPRLPGDRLLTKCPDAILRRTRWLRPVSSDEAPGKA